MMLAPLLLSIYTISFATAAIVPLIDPLSDSQFSTNSMHVHDTCEPWDAKYTVSHEHDGWCVASTTNLGAPNGPYLEINFGRKTNIHAIATKGRGCCTQYVTSYILSYYDGNTWIQYDSGFVFAGNNGNYQEEVRHELINYNGLLVAAQYIRFYPITYVGTAAMRVEAYGSKSPTQNPSEFPTETPTKYPTTITPTTYPTTNIPTTNQPTTGTPTTATPTTNNPTTKSPTKQPTTTPITFNPTQSPTVTTDIPSKSPSKYPTQSPSYITSAPATVSIDPSQNPSKMPTKYPSKSPSNITSPPSKHPSITTETPTKIPTMNPTSPTQSPIDYNFCTDNKQNGNVGNGLFMRNNNAYSGQKNEYEKACELCVCNDKTSVICDSILALIPNLNDDDKQTFMETCKLDDECSFNQVVVKKPEEKVKECGCEIFKCEPLVNNGNSIVIGLLICFAIVNVVFVQ